MNIKDTFTKLTQETIPHGYEYKIVSFIKSCFPTQNFIKDDFDNLYLIIPKKDGTYSDTMFTSHMDTINNYTGKATMNNFNLNTKVNINECKQITHVFEKDFIKTDGNTNLGADDKAGIVIMLELIEKNIPGLYYFFVGEECGCVGSGALSKIMHNLTLPKINKVISFDRRGYDGIITHQLSGRTASDEFAQEFANRLNEFGFWYKPDPTGIYTDSAEFAYDIPECTNISVGYFNEHTLYEEQDIEFLEYLCEVLPQIDFDTLPIKRNISDVSNDNYFDEFNYGYYSNRRNKTKKTNNFSIKRDELEDYKQNISKNKIDSNIYFDEFNYNDENYIVNDKFEVDTDINFQSWYNEQLKNISNDIDF